MKQTQYLILQKQSINLLISNYYQIYQYDESSYIGFQSDYEADILVRIQQINSNQCILDCQHDTECQSRYCNCNIAQIGQDCNLIIDDLTQQQIFQGGKIYYIDIEQFFYEKEEVQLQFQNSTSFYGFCITQNFNLNQISKQTTTTLHISLDQVKECYNDVIDLKEQSNSTINFYYLVYFDSNYLIYLESSNSVSDDYLLTIILSTTLSSFALCFIFCLMKSKCYPKQKAKKKVEIKYDLKQLPSLTEILFPSQEYGILRVRCDRFATYNQCLICLDPFYDDSLVRVTFCNHIFHTTCFDKWMNVHKSCPNCRSLFDQESMLKYQGCIKKDSDMLQWSSRTDEIRIHLGPLINETLQQQPQASQMESLRNIQAI
ncbi:unnamed protein product (macronuclear) [Paramecium tetraurelia]|uniref:RING-type domain-containing protein n=1 Tax=Paramecium tetraurelia TaxID=5888 RepID=A0CNQ0_PARTE|nr:uncharacterized protein GSPATT00008859001 [Paramecium tetraurelia]CAK72417.1 unnamed protein product [Paramecium tetraurelia]|eukprot:XP_001439814.1 hypothetical protein (macronuclear) [Paramecium tetraurelia strain d4-2]